MSNFQPLFSFDNTYYFNFSLQKSKKIKNLLWFSLILEILTIISKQAKEFIPFKLINAKITTHKTTKYLTSNSRQPNENLNYNSWRIPWKRSLWNFSWTKSQSWSYTLSLCTCIHSLSTRMKKAELNPPRIRTRISKKISKR